MKKILFTLTLSLYSLHVISQMGVTVNTESAYEGYTLIQPNGSSDAFLFDNDGNLVHKWELNSVPGIAIYLLENGQLLRTGRLEDENQFGGGVGGTIELVEWDGSVSWTYTISSPTEKAHHDVQYLPNGNILAVVWEVRTAAEAIEMGRDPSTVDEYLWPDKLVEIEPVGTNEANIVWEWNAWDHLIQDFDDTKANYGVVSENPGKIDINYDLDTEADWNHVNAIAYNEELDQILISAPENDEFWIIDHSTTTAEAATSSGGNSGKGGDILYRWGNPIAYKRGAVEDKKLFYQHSTRWLKEGDEWKVLLYNNGRTRPEGFISSVDIIPLPIDADGNYPTLAADEAYGPAEAEYTYQAPVPTSMYDAFVSGAQKLPNGNILILSGTNGRIFEIDSNDEIVWEFLIPINAAGEVLCLFDPEGPSGFTFRAERYSTTFSGLGSISNLGRFEGSDCALGSQVAELSNNVDYFYTLDGDLGIQSEKVVSKIIMSDLSGKQHANYSYDNVSQERVVTAKKGLNIITIQFADNTVISNKLYFK